MASSTQPSQKGSSKMKVLTLFLLLLLCTVAALQSVLLAMASSTQPSSPSTRSFLAALLTMWLSAAAATAALQSVLLAMESSTQPSPLSIKSADTDAAVPLLLPCRVCCWLWHSVYHRHLPQQKGSNKAQENLHLHKMRRQQRPTHPRGRPEDHERRYRHADRPDRRRRRRGRR